MAVLLVNGEKKGRKGGRRGKQARETHAAVAEELRKKTLELELKERA